MPTRHVHPAKKTAAQKKSQAVRKQPAETKASVPQHTCAQCGSINCYRRDKTFPEFCLTGKAGEKVVADTIEHYQTDPVDGTLARVAAEIEGRFYGRLTRAEEIVAFAKGIGAKRIGIATCLGLIEEARIFANILEVNGLEGVSVVCKVGGADKTAIGIPQNLKIKPGSHESLCNPLLQAKLLNRYKTQLNVVIGLCVGHDSIFIRHSKAPVTTLITKDRVLGHNPAAALYGCKFYYRRLLHPTEGPLSEL